MIWLIGSGPMAKDYIKVLTALKKEFIVIGRGAESSQKIKDEFGISVYTGGLENFLSTKPAPCTHAIVAVGVEQLYLCAKNLVSYGIKNILTEKPGGLDQQEISELAAHADTKTHIYLAYNRRFYSSVLKAEEIIQQDGGLSSLNFEFTEWGHTIENLKKPKAVFENWLTANSSHVIDLAFFLGGWPKEISTYVANKNKLSWYSGPTNFTGAGITDRGALFNYSANWCAPGRWGVELLTEKHRLYLRPMEQLHIQNLGSVKIEKVEIDDSLDQQFKPGLYRQAESFLTGNLSRFSSIQDQNKYFKIYGQICSQS